jgi:cation-transporting P-type ATPase I
MSSPPLRAHHVEMGETDPDSLPIAADFDTFPDRKSPPGPGRPALSLPAVPGLAGLAGAIGRTVRSLQAPWGQQAPRVLWRADGRLHIRVGGVARGAGSELGKAVESALERHDAVRWAVVNATLGAVVVQCEKDVPEAELVGIVERLEDSFETPGASATGQPPLMNRVPKAVAPAVATAAGLAFAGTGRALRVARLPAELGSVFQFVDAQPRLRGALTGAVGADRADLLLAAGNSVAQSAAQGIAGLTVDAGQRVLQLAEAVLQRDSWARAEPELCRSRGHAAAPPVTPERPQHVPAGVVEHFCDGMGVSAAAAFGGVLAMSGSARRAGGVAVATIPKAAQVGRESFAAALGCLLARRGVVVADHRALRLLDRVDTIVIDVDVLTTDVLRVGEVIPLDSTDSAHVAAVVGALFDARRVDDTVTDGSLALGPLDAPGLSSAAASRLADNLTDRGAVAVLGLAEAGRLRAVIGVIRERAGAADLLLATAQRSGARFLLAASATPAGSEPDQALVVPGGRRLVATIRGLQARGAVVLLVSSRRRALAAADVGVGLASADGRPAWGAHLLAVSGLAPAALAVEAVRVGGAASRRAMNLSLGGTALGGALAAGGPRPAAARRSLLAVNGAAAAALAASAWSVSELARLPASAPAPPPPWHAMSAAAALAELRSRPSGLTSKEVRRRWRPDERAPARLSLPRAFLGELANPLTPILAGGAVLSASIGAVADAVVVSGVGGLSALIGGGQRVYTEQSMGRLLRESAVTARVLRDGAEITIPAIGLVRGDVVLVGGGDVVPADCRLLDARALQLDESSLTGESAPVEKTTAPVFASAIADRRSMLYEGTTVSTGYATALVVATGGATELGKSLQALSQAAPPTGVESRLGQITRTTLPLALGSAAAVVTAGRIRGRPAKDTIGAAVGLAVASVPEGLPFLVTAAQLASARRLARHATLVRSPRTIEALGRTNVLCFDKTGTLTQGRMAVAAVWDGTTPRRVDALSRRHRDVLAAALRATPRVRARRGPEHVTDQAVIDGAAALELKRGDGHPGWRQLDSLPFEPNRGYHATLAETRHQPILSVKGAPEAVLPRCTKWRGGALRSADRKRVDRALSKLAKQGYRVLAVAENHVARNSQLPSAIADMTFAGLIAFGDPVRTTAGASVSELRDAGVNVVMITGDHPATATAIATELGVLNGGEVVTGADIDGLGDAALARALASATVIARCTPEHKVRVVRAFQQAGRVVAMTGDGANDAAAIRLADVGIALGKRGTPAARAAADLVVTDDQLETIIAAVIEGRAMWRSVRQAIGILVGGNIGEIGYTLFGTLMAGTSPLSARQLLLVNLLTDLLPAVTVALRTPRPGTAQSLLAEGPDTSLGSALTEEIAVRAAATGAAASAAWLLARMTGSPARARTVGLATVVGAELGQTLLVGGRSPAVAIASLASLGVLAAIVQTPGISQFFGSTPIGPVGWSIAAVAAGTATAGSALLPASARVVGPAARSLGAVADERRAEVMAFLNRMSA